MSESKQTDSRDESYYFDSLVVFKVASTLFRVPRSLFLHHSEVFRDMFALPRSDSAKVEGATDDDPICLDGYTAEEFRSLLKIMIVTECPTVPDCVAALKLAKMWHMEVVRERIVRMLSANPEVGLSAAERAGIGRDYEIHAWVLPALIELSRKERPISFAEGQALGMDWMVKLAEVREQYIPSNRDRARGWDEPEQTRQTWDCGALVRNVFSLG